MSRWPYPITEADHGSNSMFKVVWRRTGLHLILKPSKTVCKGDVKSSTMDVATVEEIPEIIPCGNPDCTGGGIALRDAASRALKTPGGFARAKCGGKEKAGLPCWNIWDITVRDTNK